MPVELIAGIIWSAALGLAAGNYACSVIHRLPRGRLLLDKTPYCGHCMTPLQTRDLFPVVSALLLRHRCRYCGTPYPKTHTITELLVAALFVFAYLHFGFDEAYILFVALGTALVILFAIEVNEKQVSGLILFAVAMLGMLLRTLTDATLYGFAMGGFYALLFAAIIGFRYVKKVGHIYVLPKPAQLFVVGGICVGAAALPLYTALFAGSALVLAAAQRISKGALPMSWSLALAVAVAGGILA
jgi:prepilin signal peptidase PulO-like enzyme (type II secretory pathway)